MIDVEPEIRPAQLPEVSAMLVAFSCGHTGWVHPSHDLGDFVECKACPKLRQGDRKVTRRVWSIWPLLAREITVTAIIEFADEKYR